MPTRVVAPLVMQSAMPRIDGERPGIAPLFTVIGRVYVLNPFDIATISVTKIGELVASFATDEDAKRRIQDALDAVLKPF